MLVLCENEQVWQMPDKSNMQHNTVTYHMGYIHPYSLKLIEDAPLLLASIKQVISVQMDWYEEICKQPLSPILKIQTFDTMDVKPVSLYTIFLIFLLYSILPTFWIPTQSYIKTPLCLLNRYLWVVENALSITCLSWVKFSC